MPTLLSPIRSAPSFSARSNNLRIWSWFSSNQRASSASVLVSPSFFLGTERSFLHSAPKGAPLLIAGERSHNPNLPPPPRPNDDEQPPLGGLAQFSVPLLAATFLG